MASYKITVLGDNAVGKTALTIQLISSYFIKSVRIRVNFSMPFAYLYSIT